MRRMARRWGWMARRVARLAWLARLGARSQARAAGCVGSPVGLRLELWQRRRGGRGRTLVILDDQADFSVLGGVDGVGDWDAEGLVFPPLVGDFLQGAHLEGAGGGRVNWGACIAAHRVAHCAHCEMSKNLGQRGCAGCAARRCIRTHPAAACSPGTTARHLPTGCCCFPSAFQCISRALSPPCALAPRSRWPPCRVGRSPRAALIKGKGEPVFGL